MTDAERVKWLLCRREELERHLREAEILVDLVKRHTAKVDKILADILPEYRKLTATPHKSHKAHA